MADYKRIFMDILDELDASDVVDVHTHLRWDVPQARSLAEIVFYHFITYELCSAGMPLEVLRLDDEREKLLGALPFLPLIRAGGTYYCLKRILQDLYGMKEECLTEDNLDEMIGKVTETAGDREWPREVLAQRARIKKSFVSILAYPDWARKVAAGDEEAARYTDIFVPVIEDNCFVAADTATIVRRAAKRSGVEVADAAGLAEAARHYVSPAELEVIKAYLGWASVDFLYEKPCAEAADAALKKALAGERTTVEEDNAVWSFAFSAFIETLRAHGIPFQFFFGSEPTAGKGPSICAYRDETFRRLSALFVDNPQMQFDLFIGSILFSQEAAIQVKMHPNLHVAGVWWHNMYPSYIRRILAERLDVCPMNKVTAFFSDSYMVEWGYGKWRMVARELAAMLAGRVAEGYITRDDAAEIARRWMWTNPAETYRLG